MTAEEERASVVAFLEETMRAAQQVRDGGRYFEDRWGISEDMDPAWWDAYVDALGDVTRAIKGGWHVKTDAT